MNKHYTYLGHAPVMVSYTYYPKSFMYNDDLDEKETIPSFVEIHDVYIDGMKSGSISLFSNRVLDQWEKEIIAYVEKKND